jgi:general secretion pathway protein F
VPLFEYKGINSGGKAVRGLKDAANKGALREQLQRAGIYVTEANEKGGRAQPKGSGLSREVNISFLGERVSVREVAVMTRQFATLQKSAIPLVECLNALTDQAENQKLKTVLATVKDKVNEGSSLAVALAEHPKVFSDLYVNMIKAGESSGNLDIVLDRLSDFMDSQVKLRAKVVGAMTYPAIMTVVGFGLILMLFSFVIPRVTGIFKQQKKALPFITELMLSISDFVSGYWWLMILAGVGAYVGFSRWKVSPKGKPHWDAWVLKMPIVGGLVRMIAVSRFSRTLATLLASGVPLLKAMDIVKNILGNHRLITVVEQARENIREGESIATPLKRSKEFPPIVTHMIAIGERAGKLEDMLENVAKSYNEQVEDRIAALTTLLEPIMIVVMGGSVAFIVFAIMLPILQMNDGIGG